MIKLIIISGRSGSGKSAALQALEDLGYYCIDNLPAALLPQLAEHFEQLNLHSKVAICIDARNPTSELAKFNQTIEGLNNRSYDISILYLDAHDDILLQRYSSTRRRHPLTSENMSLVEAIDLENTLLAPISKQATLNIDTTGMAVQMLRQVVQQQAAQQKVQNISLLIESFGFKHGLPKDADFVFDVRCLPNPYWQPELRAFTGRDQQIQDYLSADPEVNRMYFDICDFLESWLHRFEQNNRSYLTIAIGCTGGQHRSVYMVELLAKAFYSRSGNIQIRHRELKDNQTH